MSFVVSEKLIRLQHLAFFCVYGRGRQRSHPVSYSPP